jgi:peptide/nickel transport system permease protein
VNDRDLIWYGNPNFYWGYDNADVQKWVKDAQSAKTADEQTAVYKKIGRRLPITLPSSLLAFCLAAVVSLPIGITAATRRKRPFDAAVQAVFSVRIAVPVFWTGLLLVWILALKVHAFPAGGFPRDAWKNPLMALRSLALPILTIAIVMSAALIRYVRSAAIDMLGQDYLRTARALGYSSRQACWRHGLRNMTVPPSFPS